MRHPVPEVEQSAPRVVHLISDAGPHPYFRTLIEAGGPDRSSVIVGCVGPAGPLQQEMDSLGVRSFALGATSRSAYPAATLRLAQRLVALRAEIVQTHLVDGSLVGLAAARLARTPVPVMTAHHSHELPFHHRRLVWADRLCAGHLARHIIAPSHQVAEVLVRLARVAPEKIEIVHHGFDLARLDPRRVDRERVRRELSLEGKLVLGAIARFFRLKNLDALVSAFAPIAAARPEACLVIVGAGESAPLAGLVREAGLQGRVHLLGSRRDIPEVLAAVDLFVHPAIAESFGMVIVEAMAMARPVLSTPVGIAPELIEDGRNGFLAASGSVPALTEALTRALSARERWGEVGAEARRSVAHFDARTMAARYEQLYERWRVEAQGRRSALRTSAQ